MQVYDVGNGYGFSGHALIDLPCCSQFGETLTYGDR